MLKGLCAPQCAALLWERFVLPSGLSPEQVIHGRTQQDAWGRAAPVPGLGICSSWCCCWCNFMFWELALPSVKMCAWACGRGWVVCSEKFSVSVSRRWLWGIAARLGLCLLEELDPPNFAVSLLLNLGMMHRLL